MFPKGFHTRKLYDLVLHKIYVVYPDEPGAACGIESTTEEPMALLTDPIGGRAALRDMLDHGSPQKPKKVGTEMVAGLPAHVLEFTGPPPEKSKAREIRAHGERQTLLEITQISFAKPPASMFMVPAGCVAPRP